MRRAAASLTGAGFALGLAVDACYRHRMPPGTENYA